MQTHTVAGGTRVAPARGVGAAARRARPPAAACVPPRVRSLAACRARFAAGARVAPPPAQRAVGCQRAAMAPRAAAAAAPDAPVVHTTPTMGITVTVSKLPNSRRRLRCEIPLPVLKESHTATLKEIGENGALPGFRNAATAPARVLVNAIGAAKFRNAVVEHVLQATLEEALQPVSAAAFNDSEKIVTPMDAMTGVFAGGACEPTGALTYEVEVDVMPQVAWRSPYGALRVVMPAPPADGGAADVAAAAEAALAARHKELGDMRVVSGRGFRRGDTLRCDLSARAVAADGTDGELLLAFQHKNMFLDTSSADGNALPALVAGLEGATPGEKRVIDVTFPTGWSAESLRGVKARVLAAVAEVFDCTLPPLDDALAPQLRVGCATLAAAKASFLADAQAAAAATQLAARNDALLAALADATDVEVPASLLADTGRQMYAARLLEAQAKGSLTPGAMRSLMADSMVDSFLKKERDAIEASVRTQLAVEAIASLEGIAVPEDALEAEVKRTKAEFEAWQQSYDEAKVREQAREVLAGKAVLDWLHARATVVTA